MFKKNYKIIIGIVIGIIVSSIGVYAASLSSSEVTYNNSETGIESENLQDAIDELYEKSKTPNVDISTLPNIISVYEYNQETGDANYCVTGDEDTCKLSNCYKTKTENSCPPGTIVNYKVNNSKIVRFHVMHDNGETMRLQSQQNTLNNVAWYSSLDSSHGPLVALDALENATKDWVNVNTFDYSIGDSSTTLGYSGCTWSSGSEKQVYSLTKNSVRTRMITAQEAKQLGCTQAVQSCPIWMRNYLIDSTSYGGTVDDPTGYPYHTMTSNSGNTDFRWIVGTRFLIMDTIVTNPSGIRAVVEISK